MKKILFLTWKDVQHPKAGGAEVVIHEYMKGLANKGYEVTQISPKFAGCETNALLDKVHIKRMSSIHTIYFIFGIYYLLKLQNKYDIIVDHAGGIPLLSPLYAWKKKIIFFTHHVGTKERSEYFKQWIGIGAIGEVFRLLYNNCILKLYRNKHTITVSDGTANELKKLGFTDISVLKNTTNWETPTQINEHRQKRLVMIGRIVPNKRVEHAIHVIHQLKQSGYQYTLDVIGNTQDHLEYKKLQSLSKKLGCEDHIIFHGKTEHTKIIDILDTAEYLLLTSEKEGFGIVVLEANTRGVPAIGYDIPGVNEAISDGENGILIEDGDYNAIVEYIIGSQDQYNKLQESTRDYITRYPKRTDNIQEMEKILLS